MMRIEDIAAVSYRRTTGANPASIRMRYEGRSSLRGCRRDDHEAALGRRHRALRGRGIDGRQADSGGKK
jgi:hypothetical protein